MALNTSWKAIGASTLALLACGQALAVGDCCSRTAVTPQFEVWSDEGTLCSYVWSRTHRTDGKICLPLGTGYACGSERSLVVGQEYTLSGSVEIGGGGVGASAGISTTISVQEQTTHTAGECQSCQFYASYGNAAVVEWSVQKFCVWGDSQYKRTKFYNFGGAPTIMPCCEENTNCEGCRVPGGGGIPGIPGIGSEPLPVDRVGDGETDWTQRGALPGVTLVVDLRVPDTHFFFGLPAWHPMNAPGTTLATLNGWQKRKIMHDVYLSGLIEPDPVIELAIIDTDGSSTTYDLLAEPWGIVPCEADMNIDGILDLTDVSLFINYFLFGDDVIDFDRNGVIDLADIGIFTGGFVAGCP